MPKPGQTKKVDGVHWVGRLRKARKFLAIARNELDLADRADDAGPIMSNMILAAVAYADTLTAAVGGVVNQGEHDTVINTLRTVLGKDLPKAQETHLRMLLARKDQVQYGASFDPVIDAQKLAEHANAFAAWAELELARRFPEALRPTPGGGGF